MFLKHCVDWLGLFMTWSKPLCFPLKESVLCANISNQSFLCDNRWTARSHKEEFIELDKRQNVCVGLESCSEPLCLWANMSEGQDEDEQVLIKNTWIPSVCVQSSLYSNKIKHLLFRLELPPWNVCVYIALFPALVFCLDSSTDLACLSRNSRRNYCCETWDHRFNSCQTYSSLSVNVTVKPQPF